jgi:hypothetical protein
LYRYTSGGADEQVMVWKTNFDRLLAGDLPVKAAKPDGPKASNAPPARPRCGCAS